MLPASENGKGTAITIYKAGLQQGYDFYSLKLSNSHIPANIQIQQSLILYTFLIQDIRKYKKIVVVCNEH